MDPGAVPGDSTTFRELAKGGGVETASTHVVKNKSAFGMIPPLSGRFINANDNFAPVAVAANDNVRVSDAIAA